MRRLMRRAGLFYPLLFALTLLAGAGLHKFLGTEYDSGVVPLVFNAFGVIGSWWLVTSFLKGGNDRDDDDPSFGTLTLFWFLFAFFVLSVNSLVVNLELRMPGLSPDIPAWIIYAMRSAGWMVAFAAGWGCRFGFPRGWLPEGVDPAPFGFLFKKVVEIPEDGGSGR